jgi:hypothetical protein
LIARGGIEPVIAYDKTSVKLSLPQRSVHYGGWFFHHQLSAGARKVPSRECRPPVLNRLTSSFGMKRQRVRPLLPPTLVSPLKNLPLAGITKRAAETNDPGRTTSVRG